MSSMGNRLGLALPSPSQSSPIHDDDLLTEILIRLPPLPSSIPHVSLVCTRWRRLVTDPYFLRRFRTHHWKPLGLFFRDLQAGEEDLTFTPFSDARDSVTSERFSVSVRRECHEEGDGQTWKFRGCRHGRLLLADSGPSSFYGLRTVQVWNPVSGERHFIATPQLWDPNAVRVHAAVTCASGDNGPFKVALAWIDSGSAHACVYSSDTGEWGGVISAVVKSKSVHTLSFGNVLVGNSLYWIIFGTKIRILEFDLSSHNLAVVRVPSDVYADHYGLYLSTLAKGGGLSLVSMSDNFGARVWERTADSNGVAQWMLGRTIELCELLLLRPMAYPVSQRVISLAGDDNVIFVSTHRGVFMVHLESMQFEKIFETNPLSNHGTIHPFTDIYPSGTSLKKLLLEILI